MNYSGMGAQRYRETDLGTMTPEKMIVLLYERLVRDIECAHAAVDDPDRVVLTRHVSHAQSIVSELRNALDHSVGGELATNLESLYDYLFQELLLVIVDRSPRRLEECLVVLQPLLAAWRDVPAGAGEQESKRRVSGADADSGADPASLAGDTAAGETPPGRPDRLLSVSV